MLKKGQIVYIRGEKNVIINMIEFKEETWVWQEYEVVNKVTGKHSWLSVEQDENNCTEYYLYETYKEKINENSMEFVKNGYKYKLYENGTAYVKSYFGNADVDKNERVTYKDFKCESKNKIISVEIWENEKEITFGYKLENNEINISDEFDQTEIRKLSVSSFSGNIVKPIIVFILALMVPIMALLPFELSKNSIQSYLKKNTSKYEYITSVTNNENNKKARVYLSKYSTIDETVKDIIKAVPEGITKTKDLEESTEEDGIGLETKREFAYVYIEDGKVYVQVSDKKYVESSGSTYHSHHRSYYYRTYRTSNENSSYKEYRTSARQSSINSRRSSGGGTSSGK